MKKLNKFMILLTLSAMSVMPACRGNNRSEDDLQKNIHEYSASTENLRQSDSKIDGARTYEVFFTIEKPVECFSVSLDTVFLQKTFPVQNIPQKSYFIVEKILVTKGYSVKNNKTYIQIGKNFNNNWDIHNPVKICGKKSDPVSGLDTSIYRIRFSTFDTRPVFFTVTVHTTVEVLFGTEEKFKEKTTAPD